MISGWKTRELEPSIGSAACTRSVCSERCNLEVVVKMCFINNDMYYPLPQPNDNVAPESVNSSYGARSSAPG